MAQSWDLDRSPHLVSFYCQRATMPLQEAFCWLSQSNACPAPWSLTEGILRKPLPYDLLVGLVVDIIAWRDGGMAYFRRQDRSQLSRVTFWSKSGKEVYPKPLKVPPFWGGNALLVVRKGNQQANQAHGLISRTNSN